MADAIFPLEKLPVELQLQVWEEAVRSPGIHFFRLRVDFQMPTLPLPVGSLLLDLPHTSALDLPLPGDVQGDLSPSCYNLSAYVRTHRLRASCRLARFVVDEIIRDAADPTSKDHLAGWRVERNLAVTESPDSPSLQAPLLLNMKTDTFCVVTPFSFSLALDIRFRTVMGLDLGGLPLAHQFPQLRDVRRLAVHDIIDPTTLAHHDDYCWIPAHFPHLEVVYLVNFNIRPSRSHARWEIPHGAETYKGNGCRFVEVRSQDASMWDQPTCADALGRAQFYNENRVTPRMAFADVLQYADPSQEPPASTPDFWTNSGPVSLPDESDLNPDPCKVRFKVLTCLRS